MPDFCVLFAVFLPIVAGAALFFMPGLSRRTRNIYTFVLSIVNLALVLGMFFAGGSYDFKLIDITTKISISFRIDGLGRMFGSVVSILWPFTLLYSYEYMEDEERLSKFYGFFMMTLGAVEGICFSKDLFTMYIFYELLTLLTFPLVMHEMTDEAMKAGRQYLVYMLGGAAFAFMGIMVLVPNTSTLDFTYLGTLLANTPASGSILVVTFFIMFCGFSVKAAMMPFGMWLIKAAVAPMPVTALLHAVAVVKAGAFACIRLIYFVYGPDFLRGTWAQYTLIIMVSLTILFGSVMSVKEPHLKRKMAYSTISNLSYVLFGALIMTPLGLVAGLSHFIVHAITKIGLFFCVGSIMHTCGKSYLYETDNLGRRMKKIYVAFTLCSFSLIGIPQFAGFISKIKLLTASIASDDGWNLVGAMAIIVSALLTAVYLLTIVIRGYFPKNNAKCENFDECHDPGWKMLVPIYFSAVMTILIGIFWKPLLDALGIIARLGEQSGWLF